MTKAKMPVAKHRVSRSRTAWARQVWTEELTLDKAGAIALGPAGARLACAPVYCGLQSYLHAMAGAL